MESSEGSSRVKAYVFDPPKLTRRRVLQRFTLARFFGRILKGCQEAAHAD